MPQRPFLYFDMGNVLLFFSHERMAAQMAAVVGITPERAWQILFEGDLGTRHEEGRITEDQFYDEFCRLAGVANLPIVDREALEQAANDIFWLHVPMVALTGRLDAAGYRLGVLSNTNRAHWRFVSGRFAYLTSQFSVYAMSFNSQAMKPARKIYLDAARLAGVPPEEIFYTDDRPENVAGAKEAGFDAVQFTTPAALARELLKRGIVVNH
ncbi:MAG: HAD family phosphatase [Planctomycetaceae bacterium]|nr:HAD family phosphatase [Planctomycetaceae bacterium]